MTQPPEPLQPGHFWKTPFVWSPGDPTPPPTSPLRFEPAPDDWLREAIAAVMADSMDDSDRAAVTEYGPARAVDELLAIVPEYFTVPDGWWRAGVDGHGRRVGFVLPVLFKAEQRFKDGRPQATVLYMGVMPQCRGHGHGLELLHEATRLALQAGCWRLFCDTGSDNAPMVNAFRRAGWQERAHWQRPLL